jgi:hypothetical protein
MRSALTGTQAPSENDGAGVRVVGSVFWPSGVIEPLPGRTAEIHDPIFAAIDVHRRASNVRSKFLNDGGECADLDQQYAFGIGG